MSVPAIERRFNHELRALIQERERLAIEPYLREIERLQQKIDELEHELDTALY